MDRLKLVARALLESTAIIMGVTVTGEQAIIVLYIALGIFLLIAWRYGFRQHEGDAG